MIEKAGLTRIEAIVVIACIVFLFINIGALTAGGRAGAKKEVCLANMKTLTFGWLAYAESNAGKLVNGAAMGGGNNPPGVNWVDKSGIAIHPAAKAPTSTSDYQYGELPWIGQGWGDWCTNEVLPEDCQGWAMQTGALWKYIKDPQIYHCPTGMKGQMVSYIIMDNMNGCGWRRTANSLAKSLTYKNRNQIKRANQKIVFLDGGSLTPDSFAIRYNGPWGWWDGPFVRHGNGTTVSFADGHAVWWLWKSKSTVALGKAKESGNPCNLMSTQPPDLLTNCATFNDFYKIWSSFYGNLLAAAGVIPPVGCKLEEAE